MSSLLVFAADDAPVLMERSPPSVTDQGSYTLISSPPLKGSVTLLQGPFGSRSTERSSLYPAADETVLSTNTTEPGRIRGWTSFNAGTATYGQTGRSILAQEH